MLAMGTKINSPERWPSGNIRPATQRPYPPTLVKRVQTDARRKKLDVTQMVEDAERRNSDPNMGTQLGELYMRGIITLGEFEAGILYADAVGRHDRAIGAPLRYTRSHAYEGGNGDTRVDLEALYRMDPERAAKIEDKTKRRIKHAKRKYDEAQTWVPGDRARDVLDRLCCDDLMLPEAWHPGVKAVLGNLAKHVYKINQARADDDRPAKRRNSAKADARILADATCAAIIAWFEREKGVIHAFDVSAGRHKARRITAYGVWNEKTPLTHFIDVRLNGLMPAVLDAQLVKMAISKGWAEASKRKRT